MNFEDACVYVQDDYEPQAWGRTEVALVAGPGELLIALTGGYEALIDEADYPLLQGKRFYAHKARSNTYARNRRLGYLHQLICGVEPGCVVDHKNRNSLDCRRHNLHIVGRSANAQNADYKRASATGFRGVYRSGRSGFMAQIRIDGTTRCLGTFRTPEEAAKAYNDTALALHGEHSWVNAIENRLPPQDIPF